MKPSPRYVGREKFVQKLAVYLAYLRQTHDPRKSAPDAAEKRDAAQKSGLSSYYRSLDPELARRQRVLAEHDLPVNARALGAQDLTWALLNSPEFLFNH